MKTTVTFVFILSLLGWNMTAQMGTIALHKIGEVQYFNTSTALVSAYEAAVNGDTLYIPGGSFTPPSIFRKRLMILGVGHYPDSTQATNATIFNTHINIGHEADGLHLEGVKIMGQIGFESNAVSGIDNVIIRRCYMQNLLAAGGVVHNNNLFTENVILDISDLSALQSSGFYNNIIQNRIFNIYSNIFENNIFLFHGTAGYYTINNAISSVFNNNIFENFGVASGNANAFSHNLIGATSPTYGSNPSLNNNYAIDPEAVYMGEINQIFEYNDNFHLQSAALLLLGNDGTQTGIYGGAYPYKEGAVPVTPHISSKIIGTTSNNQGKIEVNIKVHAQTR